jgi:uncharacterized OB-fold protein
LIAAAVAQNVFIGRDRSTRLLAGRSAVDGTYRFPLPVGPGAAAYEVVELGPSGTLWSFTVQRFRPKPPFNGRGGEAEFRPFAVGYVEFLGQLIVEGRIVVDDFATLRIGQAMILTTEAYRDDPEGQPVLTYAFAIDRGAGGQS